MELLEIAGLSWLATLVKAAIAVGLSWLMLRWWDRRAGLVWRGEGGVVATLMREPRALALYLGGRVIAVLLLVGLVLGGG